MGMVWILNSVENGYIDNSADELGNVLRHISDAFHDLVPIVQFKKCERQPWRSAHACFSRLLNCTNGIKSRKASHLCK